MANVLHPQPGQLGIEGIGLDVPLAATVVRPLMSARNAFTRVPFPQYFGIDPTAFEVVTTEAYAQSAPEIIEPKLYRRTGFSLKSPDMEIGWVVVSPSEHANIIDSPENFAQRAQSRYLQRSLSAELKPQEDRNATAQRAGAHALEATMERMHNLLIGYRAEIDAIRVFLPKIPKQWLAHGSELEMRLQADVVRNGMQENLQTMADIESWSEDELQLALLGLDKRLMEGRGRQRMEEKKSAWTALGRVVGNHTIAKRVVVRDRYLRSKFEIEKRLKAGRVE